MKKYIFRHHNRWAVTKGGIIADHEGQECTVIIEGLNPGVPMHLVKFADGFTLAVFPDELYDIEMPLANPEAQVISDIFNANLDEKPS